MLALSKLRLTVLHELGSEQIREKARKICRVSHSMVQMVARTITAAAFSATFAGTVKEEGTSGLAAELYHEAKRHSPLEFVPLRMAKDLDLGKDQLVEMWHSQPWCGVLVP